MKKAIIIATFGSTYLDSLYNSLEPLITDIKNKYPDFDIFIGFTSKFIKDFLEKNGIKIQSISDILNELVDSNYNNVIIFANFLIPGTEYNKLLKTVQNFKVKFNRIELRNPYLNSNKSLKDISEFIINQNNLNSNKFYLYMGHGSNHPGNKMYESLNNEFKKKSIENIRIACIDGNTNFKSLISSKILENYKEIELKPFMLIAGDHVKNDMIKNEDSWLNQLKSLGFNVNYKEEPLLKYKEFRKLILK